MSHEARGLAGKAVLIAGPTASGKSAVALTLAERLGGVVINADSMQVYRDLRVLTARPSAEDEARAPHALYGHVDAAENYSVGRWLADVRGSLDDAKSRNLVPILVGGTGLYFRALLEGIAATPPVASEVRAAVRARLEAGGPHALHAELAIADPAMAARLNPGDRTRVARALEVVLGTGRSLADWQGEGLPSALPAAETVRLFLTPYRETLNGVIERRFAGMLEADALDEVRALDARRLDPLLPAMKAHGVPWLRRHLHGEIALDAAAAGAVHDTRRYTKRQMTWFRHQMPGFRAVDPGEAVDAALSLVRLGTT